MVWNGDLFISWWNLIQLHLLDEVTGAHIPVNTMWQAQFKHLTCIIAAPQPSRDRYSNHLHFERGEAETQEVELTQVHTANEW